MSKSFGEAVAAAREARPGLTQAALGAMVGVTGQQIARIESGKRCGSAKVLAALALELEIDLNLLKSNTPLLRRRSALDADDIDTVIDARTPEPSAA